MWAAPHAASTDKAKMVMTPKTVKGAHGMPKGTNEV
jgi:hypothetical protein